MYLRLNDLSKHFAGRDGSSTVRAVDQVTIDIEQGQFVTLLGPSGCGKTTTLRLIAGFEFPTAGEIILDGELINEQPPNRRDMAMVFQSYAIFPHLTVFENIAYGLRIKRLNERDLRAKVSGVLDLTELTGLENRAPNQLSGGQQQRVALARALVMEPKVLLFDEPLSNLDAKLRVQMRGEIRRIQQELGITSVYVTHDQDEAMVLSDLIVVMHQGRIQQAGSAVEIYRRPINRFVADFIGRANFIPVEVIGRDEQGWQVRVQDMIIHAPAAASADLQPGAQALLLARPESVRVHHTPQTGATLFPGELLRTAYLGSIAEFEVRAVGQLMAAVLNNPSDEDLLPVHTPVYVELLRDNLFLLPASTA